MERPELIEHISFFIDFVAAGISDPCLNHPAGRRPEGSAVADAHRRLEGNLFIRAVRRPITVSVDIPFGTIPVMIGIIVSLREGLHRTD